MDEDRPLPSKHEDPQANDRGDPESTFELIDRARKGDQVALDRLFARHLRPLQRWASGRLPGWARDLADTDDLVQDTLLQTFKRIGDFEARRVGALQAYLRQAVVNRVRDELRRKGRRPDSTDLDGVELDAAQSPLEEAIGRRPSSTISTPSSDSSPKSERRSSPGSRWTTPTRSWRRCLENRHLMRRAKRHSERSCGLPRK